MTVICEVGEGVLSSCDRPVAQGKSPSVTRYRLCFLCHSWEMSLAGLFRFTAHNDCDLAEFNWVLLKRVVVTRVKVLFVAAASILRYQRKDKDSALQKQYFCFINSNVAPRIQLPIHDVWHDPS